MKAIFFEEHGAIDRLKFADLPDPKPAPGYALIKVRAVALNHLDIWVREGWHGLRLEMPHIGGSDVAGEIVSVNGAAGPWKKGAPVVINPGIVSEDDEWTRKGQDSISPGYKILGEQVRGGLAEFVTAPIQNIFAIPQGISFEDAAAPLLVGTTCWRMLFKQARLTPGETVLVVGAGGGVNSLTISLAHATGATVIALAGGPEKCARARTLGATHVIDYKATSDWHIEVLKLTKGRGVDVVCDNVGKATFEKSLRAVARGGRIVTVGNTSGYSITFDNRLLFAKQVSLIGSTMGSRQDFIDAMTFMWNRGIKVPIDCVEPLSAGIKMIKRLEDGEQFGKIVLVP